ncbi:hypothetical protein BH10PLA1_BH10PLA1_15380 [soil metagenome]
MSLYRIFYGLVIFSAIVSAANAETVSLLTVDEPNFGWTFTNGPEFPGSSGGIEIDGTSLKLTGKFTRPVAYVSAGKDLDGADVTEISFRIRDADSDACKFRVIDSAGQVHQISIKTEHSDSPRTITFPLAQFFEKRGTPDAVPNIGQYQYFGGPKDGHWHGPAKSLQFLISPAAGKTERTIWLDEVKITANKPEAVVSTTEGFEGKDKLGDGWKTEGNVSIDKAAAFKDAKCLLLDRTREQMELPCSAKSPDFAVGPGVWEFGIAAKSDLDSPDSSYNASVEVEWIDAGGKAIDHLPLALQYGKMNWQVFSKRIELPAGATKAHFKAKMNKAAGQFRVDAFSAASVAAPPKKDLRITGAMFESDTIGNLFLPTDKRVITLTVFTSKQLKPEQMNPNWVIRDYWGAEQSQPSPVKLEAAGQEKGTFLYKAAIEFSAVPLQVGRYYEIFIDFPLVGDETFHEYSSFAILPEAEANQFAADDVPFTSRSWDNRVPETFPLTHRLGIRICGVASGWSAEAPAYGLSAPNIELCDQLGMRAICRTPGFVVERRLKGYEKFDDATLRAGVRAFVEKFGKGRIYFLGNEPHGTGDAINANFAAYKSMYEELKKVDPTCLVIGTAVGPEEEYFQKGFQPYCDVYDFHTYADYKSIRKTFSKYRELFAKYGGEKPIWSTETGLNSHGMTRQAIAAEMIRKFCDFFAEGGGKISWFGTAYPDTNLKLHGNADDAMNVFDGRYRKFAPRLDALTYYYMVNNIGVKKFADEKHYGDINAFLFAGKDNDRLLVMWKDKGRQDIGLPIAWTGNAKLTLLDGTSVELSSASGTPTITVTEDAVLVRFQSDLAKLPAELAAPAIRVTKFPESIVKGGDAPFTISYDGKDEVRVIAPPFWQVTKSLATTTELSGGRTFIVKAPEQTNAREAQFLIVTGATSNAVSIRVPVAGKVAMRLLATPATAGGAAGVKIVATNNGAESQDVAWSVSIDSCRPMADGQITGTAPVDAYFAQAASGVVNIAGHTTKEIAVPMASVDPLTVYTVTGSITEASGKTTTITRPIAGFATVAHAAAPITVDGVLDEAEWSKAVPILIDQARMYNTFKKPNSHWNGPADLSANVKMLWDDKALYVSITVTDDKFNNPKQDGDLWNQDAVQLLIDPARETDAKPGKYDYTFGLGQKGVQGWCALTADPGSPTGEIKDMPMAIKHDEANKTTTYELAFPWSRVAPFKPDAGGNLGMAIGLPEDEGSGRQALMSWFGNVHSKQIDSVGDLILAP